MWSKSLMPYFPKARYLLIEAQNVHKRKLESLARKTKNVEFVLAAAGDKAGKIYFDAREPFGGKAAYEQIDSSYIEIPMTTVDIEVDTRSFNGPFLLKLDTHGFEVPILKGAESVLKRTNAICIEVYNFRLCEECLTFYEMCGYLEKEGFRVARICNPSYRPKDGLLWQMDFLFLRSDRVEFSDNQYS
jgi:FkbM family methyltransferase